MTLAPLPDHPTLTVVIPTLNEAERLPTLLGRLAAQTRPADATVVADAGSTDATREIAEGAGALVVQGGMPGPGRNAGAAAAATDLILFLDADDEPSDNWIEMAVPEFLGRSLAVAAGQVEPLEREPANVVACEAVNLFLQLVQYVVPHAPGFCILVRRDVHEAIGGFDETVVLAEDHEYVQRAAEVGKFRILRSAPMRTSMRRIEKEGLVTLAFKYVYSEVHVMAGKPMREVPFEYEFAAFDREKSTSMHVGSEALREMWTAIGEPLERLSSDSMERIRMLGEAGITPESIELLLREIAPDEIVKLSDYVSRRLEYARRLRPIVLRRIRRTGERVWRDIVTEFRRE